MFLNTTEMNYFKIVKPEREYFFVVEPNVLSWFATFKYVKTYCCLRIVKSEVSFSELLFNFLEFELNMLKEILEIFLIG